MQPAPTQIGNRTGLSGPWGYTAGFAYDGLDRLWGTSESGYPTTQLTYDAVGRRSALASGFGTMTSSASSLYDAAGRLQVHAHDLAGTAADQSVTFGYNPASRITSEARTSDAYASNTAYNVNRSYAANGLNQYAAAGSAQLAYDANGNLAASPAGDGGTVAYVYDAENHLVQATTSGGTGGTRVVTLSYDPNGRLWQVAAPSGTTRFVYDGDQILIEADGVGNLLRAYVHGTAEDEPLVWYEALPGGASRRFLHADHQGSIVAVADQDGNPLAINAYDAWASRTPATSAGPAAPARRVTRLRVENAGARRRAHPSWVWLWSPPGSVTPSRATEAASAWSERLMSPSETMPTSWSSRLSTGMRRTWLSLIFIATSSTSSSS